MQHTQKLSEIIKAFPGILDEQVQFTYFEGGSILTTEKATFQFVGDGNYRTTTLQRDEVPLPSTIIRNPAYDGPMGIFTDL